MNCALLDLVSRDCEGLLAYGLPEQEVVSTGFPQLDAAMGGGIPRGRIVEIHGREDSGKTALALHLAARLPGPTLYVDADHDLSPHMLHGAGELYKLDVGTLEDTLDVCLIAVRSGAFGAVVIDTVAALPTNKDMRTSINSEFWPELDWKPAEVMSKALPILAGALRKAGCTLILVNQLRDRPGLCYGNTEEPTGGEAIGYYAALRVDTSRCEPIKDGKDATIGHFMRVRVTKNKLAPPGREARLHLSYREGLTA